LFKNFFFFFFCLFSAENGVVTFDEWGKIMLKKYKKSEEKYKKSEEKVKNEWIGCCFLLKSDTLPAPKRRPTGPVTQTCG